MDLGKSRNFKIHLQQGNPFNKNSTENVSSYSIQYIEDDAANTHIENDFEVSDETIKVRGWSGKQYAFDMNGKQLV